MSRKMEKAYFALTLKDCASAFASTKWMREGAWLMLGAALLCINTIAFKAIAMVAVVMFATYYAMRVIAIACDRRIRSLGFSEIELEMLGLA